MNQMIVCAVEQKAAEWTKSAWTLWVCLAEGSHCNNSRQCLPVCLPVRLSLCLCGYLNMCLRELSSLVSEY